MYPRHIRVKVYHTLDTLYEESALWDDVPLTGGVLRLFFVRKRFGLQNCTVSILRRISIPGT